MEKELSAKERVQFELDELNQRKQECETITLMSDNLAKSENTVGLQYI